MRFSIDPSVFELFPEVGLGVVQARHVDNSRDDPEVVEILRRAERDLPRIFGEGPVADHPRVSVWREAYRKFGAKPKATPSSVENLVRRVLGGELLRPVNNLVSLYNAVSLTHLLPVGGEDRDRLSGDVRLTRAGPAEPPVILLGEKDPRSPHEGEVIYTDDIGALCRRWNWKEADRTKLTPETKNVILVIESLPPLPPDALPKAADDLAALVERHLGGTVSTLLLHRGNPEGILR
ncbi:MAG TPA: phenylalanine--tRNA ligase beta subunit-related protein [Synergistaceae bacterium]|nr:phenylalanine--tRNA ligase beta subunit-related protein [Synergistaceae bacterium]HQH78637.1 phenylalanine--tRNA ligase beta subunit-related protein [Synergistaceae bacterium]HQK26063.1 phenylalanine--tRNA ligase beta subunit-related protein [Synergistaceae bacterium]